MTITFAGVELLLEDPEGTVRRWLDRYLDETAASIFCTGNTAVRDLRNESIAIASSVDFAVARVGLPVGNYPVPPRPKINSLYHPTGAKRWTQGLFLVRGDSLTSILDEIPNGESAVLRMADDSDPANVIEHRLHLLPPRPVSPPNVPSADRLWLLPLVCPRYFWQQWYVGEYAPTTWDECLSLIGGADSPQFAIAMDEAFGRPFVDEWKRPHEQSAMLIDAIALSTLRRVVREDSSLIAMFQGYSLLQNITSRIVVDDNLSSGWCVIAGGDFSNELRAASRPASVGVSFPFPASGAFMGEWQQYTSATATPYNLQSQYGYHCPRVDTSGSDPVLQAYADNVAYEHLVWLDRHYDITYAGIVPWRQTGHDDYVRWEFARKRNGKYVAQTRAVSMPPNFGCDCLPVSP